MLRATSPASQSERTIAALAWATAHGVLDDCQARFANVIAFLEALPLHLALAILREPYCPDRGRPAYDPLLMFRTELARRVLRVDSRDSFADTVLAPSPFLRLLLGYPSAGAGRTPSGQTLRRFEHRIVPSRRRGVTLPKKTGHTHDNLSERAASFLARAHGRPVAMRRPSTVDRLLRVVGFEPARAAGLIPDDATVITDGTLIDSRTNPRGQKLCQHGRKSCQCQRRYTDPFARYGYDHHERRHVYGYNASITAVDSLLLDPLAVSITMHPASRHDGVATLATLTRAVELYPEAAGCFATQDAASDSAAHGWYLRHLGLGPITPVRDPGKGRHAIDNISFTADGVPLCAGGYPMRPHGTVGERQRWICPGEVATSGVDRHQPCHRWGFRTISFRPQDSYRLISALHRGSKAFKAIYARRAAIERSINKPAMADGQLQHGSRVQSRGRHHTDARRQGGVFFLVGLWHAATARPRIRVGVPPPS